MYGLILGHVLWKDFAQLRDQKALEFLAVTVDKIKIRGKMETRVCAKICSHLSHRQSILDVQIKTISGRFYVLFSLFA